MWLSVFSSFDIRALEEKYFNAVDLVEEAFDKLADNAVSGKYLTKSAML